MRLYYTPGACSMAAHIVAVEEGIVLECIKVDLATHLTLDGTDFRRINPKGYVPALALDEGGVLTENVAILLYLAHKKPRSGIAPLMGDPAWFGAVEWLTYVATEMHQGFAPLWIRNLPEASRKVLVDKLSKKLDFLELHLRENPYLLPGGYSIADAYLFVVLNWAEMVRFDLNPWPQIRSYRAIVGDRPAVRQVLKAEGLRAG